MAHIGGYIFGASIPITLLWLHAIPREPFDLFSIGRQAKRRRDFKALTHKTSPWRADLPSQSRVGNAPGKSRRPAPDEAITSARYLNDPIRASRLLEELRTAHLDESAQSLADQLREEIA